MSEVVATATTELNADSTKLIRALHDGEVAVKQSAQAGEKAFGDSGKKAGTLFGTAVTGGLKILGAGASLAFGLATKGAIELEDQVAEFTAATGASAEEAERAGKAINGMSSRNIQPMREIGAALINVHTQMGLTGDEAERTTQDFLTFGRATGQDAAAAVTSFDNILDAWGLTAKDSRGIMDQLVASHQKFGGSIEQNQAALSVLAPALKAMNLSVDDGIGLLNLFASTGLDASSAQRALNTAVQNLPPGENLKTVIARLAGIEDQSARTSAAVAIFGPQLGVKLANAIRPGTKGLDDFIITAQSAAGKTRAAADAMNNTFGAKVQLMLKQFGSALVDVGTKFGPLLTGLAAVGSLAGALGIDELVKVLGPKMVAAFRTLGGQAAQAIGDGFDSVMSGAEGTIIGNLTANAIEKAGGSRIRGVGTLLGGAFTTAFVFALKVAEGVASQFVGQPAGTLSTSVIGAGTRVGTLFGATAGTAAGAALRAAVLLSVVGIADVALNELKKVPNLFGGAPLQGIGDAINQWTRDTQWPFGNANPPDWAVAAGLAKAGGQQMGTAMTEGLAGTLDLSTTTQTAVTEVRERLEAADVKTASTQIGLDISKPIGDGGKAASAAVLNSLNTIVTGFTTARSQLAAIATGAANAIWDPQIKAAEIAQTKLDLAEQRRIINDKNSTGAQIREAQNRTTQLQKQLFIQISDISTYGTNAQQIAAIKAALASKDVAAAYRNGTPEQRAAIDLWRKAMNDKMTELEGTANRGGKDASAGVASGIRSGSGNVAGAARGIANDAAAPIKGLAGNAERYGENTSASYAQGILNGKDAVMTAVNNVMHAARLRMQAFSPPGPLSPLHDIDKWGKNTAEAWAEGLLRGRPAVSNASEALARAVMLRPELPEYAAGLSPRGPVLPGSTTTTTVNAPITVTLPMGWRGTPAEIAALADQLANHLRLSMTPRLAF